MKRPAFCYIGFIAACDERFLKCKEVLDGGRVGR